MRAAKPSTQDRLSGCGIPFPFVNVPEPGAPVDDAALIDTLEPMLRYLTAMLTLNYRM